MLFFPTTLPNPQMTICGFDEVLSFSLTTSSHHLSPCVPPLLVDTLLIYLFYVCGCCGGLLFRLVSKFKVSSGGQYDLQI